MLETLLRELLITLLRKLLITLLDERMDDATRELLIALDKGFDEATEDEGLLDETVAAELTGALDAPTLSQAPR